METLRTKFLGLAFLLGGLLLCGIGLRLLLGPAQYQATVRIRALQDYSEIENYWHCHPEKRPAFSYDVYVPAAVIENLQSDAVLGKVVTNLNLNVAWAKAHAGRAELSLPDAVCLLRHCVKIRSEFKTDNYEIGVTRTNPAEAAKIANAIAEAYRAFRIERWRQLILNGIRALTEQYQQEEQHIQRLQSNVDSLLNNLGSISSVGTSPAWVLNACANRLREYQQRQSNLNRLQALSPDQRRAVLPAIFPDNCLSNLLLQLHTTEQGIALATNDHSNAAVLSQLQMQLDDLNQQIDARMNGIILALENQVQSDRAVLQEITNTIHEAQMKQKEEAVRENQLKSYQDQEHKLQETRNVHEMLKKRIEHTRAELDRPSFSTVDIVNPAIPPQVPVGPDRLLGGLLFAVGLFPCVGGFLLLKSAFRQSV